jgi:hypothetical protein
MIRIPLLIASAIILAPGALAQELSDADRAINNTIAVGEATQAPTQWLGAVPHFVMIGEFDDYTFAINAPDPEAAGVALAGKREYRPNGEALDFIDFEVALDAVIGGIERSIEMEFENANFAAYEFPADFALQGAAFPEGNLSNLELEFEWEWVEKSVVVNEEALFTDGTLTFALNEGEADERGLSDSGVIGGFVTVTRDGQTLAISFTAPVREAEIDE